MTVVEFVEDDEHRAQIGPDGIQNERLPGNSDRVDDALCGECPLLDAFERGDRSLERGRIGQLHVDDQIAFVLRGDESCRNVRHAEVREPNQSAINQEDDHAQPQRHPDHPAVDSRDEVEPAIEPFEESRQHAVHGSRNQIADDRAGNAQPSPDKPRLPRRLALGIRRPTDVAAGHSAPRAPNRASPTRRPSPTTAGPRAYLRAHVRARRP